MKRLLALAGALGMVAVALLVRGMVDDDGDGAGASGDDDGADRTIVCPPDLAHACGALRGVTVRVEEAGTTADALRGGTLDPAVDGWMVPSVWVDVVASGDPDALDGRGTLVATSPVVVAVDPARVGAVTSLCTGDPLWRCIGDAAGARWGELGGDGQWGALRVGLPHVDTGPGLAVLASVATAYFEGTDFAAQDFDHEDFRPWLATLVGTSQPDETDPLRTLVTARGTYTAAAVLRSESTGRTVDVLAAEPVVEAQVTLVAVTGRGGVPDPTPARDALADAGWDPAEGETPASPYLPGVLAALRTLGSDVAR